MYTLQMSSTMWVNFKLTKSSISAVLAIVYFQNKSFWTVYWQQYCASKCGRRTDLPGTSCHKAAFCYCNNCSLSKSKEENPNIIHIKTTTFKQVVYMR